MRSPPSGPRSNLTATVQAGPQVGLTWTDTALNENGFTVQRSTDGGATFTTIATPPARTNVGGRHLRRHDVTLGTTYTYRVAANTVAGHVGLRRTLATVTVGVPAGSERRRRRGNGPNQGNRRAR